MFGMYYIFGVVKLKIDSKTNWVYNQRPVWLEKLVVVYFILGWDLVVVKCNPIIGLKTNW